MPATPSTPRSTRPSASRWAEQLGRIFERVAVLALNGTSAEIVAVHGLSHAALGVSLSLVERTPLRWAIEAASPVVGSGKSPGGASVAIALGVAPPRGYVVVPLAMPGGIVGLAYADRGPHPLSLTEVSAAFGFCQTVLAGGSVPTARRPRSSGRRAARATRARARRSGSPDRIQALGADPGEAGRQLDPLPEDPEVVGAGAAPLAATPRAADESPRRAMVDLAPLAAEPPAPSSPAPLPVLGDDTASEGADEGAAFFSSLVQASLAELSRTAGPATQDNLPLVEDEVVIGADALESSSWDQSWAARPSAVSVAPVPTDGSDEDALETEPQPVAPAGWAIDPPDSVSTAPDVTQAPAGELEAAVLSAAAAGRPSVAPSGDAAAPGRRSEAPSRPATPAPMAVRRERRSSRAPARATPATVGMFAPPLGVSGFVTGPTLYAQQVAVVTPAGIVPLDRVRPHSGLARAITTAAAAVATVVALVLTLVAPASSPSSPPRSVVVPPQASVASISRELEADGLVRSAAGFAFLARLTGADRDLRAGTYRLSPGAWAWEQLGALTGGQVQTVSVTVPEGLTLREVATLLEEHHFARVEDVVTAASDPALLARYDLPGPTAEGFLFPETYSFAEGVSPHELVDAMVREFFARVTAIPGAATAGRDELVRKVILASLVEREARDPRERPRIAGVFQNRLDRGMRLESCATVQYVLGHPKEKLTVADVRRQSPYNTYLHPGLPPAPIANPGLESLRAAFAPERHDLLFFFARDDGSHRHVFNRTYADHMSSQRLLASREKARRAD